MITTESLLMLELLIVAIHAAIRVAGRAAIRAATVAATLAAAAIHVVNERQTEMCVANAEKNAPI
jgi:hypothetical protein